MEIEILGGQDIRMCIFSLYCFISVTSFNLTSIVVYNAVREKGNYDLHFLCNLEGSSLGNKLETILNFFYELLCREARRSAENMGKYWQAWWSKNSYSCLTTCSRSRIVEARSFHKLNWKRSRTKIKYTCDYHLCRVGVIKGIKSDKHPYSTLQNQWIRFEIH